MDINHIYNTIFDEENRLTRNKASSIEFITNQKYILDSLTPGDTILELGAGTGRYTLMLADRGYNVTALEYVKEHVLQLTEKLKPHHNVNCIQGTALDLSQFADETFDVVLNMGPLYHTKDVTDQVRILKESLRVLKKGGVLVVAFINNDMVFVTESLFYNPDFLIHSDTYYNNATHAIHGELFTFHTVDQIRELMDALPLYDKKVIASDGYAELLSEKINDLGPDAFKKWLAFHLYTCEKKESLNASHHLLYIAKKI